MNFAGLMHTQSMYVAPGIQMTQENLSVMFASGEPVSWAPCSGMSGHRRLPDKA